MKSEEGWAKNSSAEKLGDQNWANSTKSCSSIQCSFVKCIFDNSYRQANCFWPKSYFNHPVLVSGGGGGGGKGV